MSTSEIYVLSTLLECYKSIEIILMIFVTAACMVSTSSYNVLYVAIFIFGNRKLYDDKSWQIYYDKFGWMHLVRTKYALSKFSMFVLYYSLSNSTSAIYVQLELHNINIDAISTRLDWPVLYWCFYVRLSIFHYHKAYRITLMILNNAIQSASIMITEIFILNELLDLSSSSDDKIILQFY